jgi:hypothetical protein
MNNQEAYHKGDTVSDEGDYVCVPCGFRKHLKPGKQFPECTSCLSGTEEGHDDYVEGLELWEKVQPIPEE